MKITNVVCQYEENFLGVDTFKPIFSFKIISSKKAIKQRSYRIVISSSNEKLDTSDYDIWDSGEVIGDSTTGIEYNGKKLSSCTQYYFKIYSMLNNGIKLESEINYFETAFLKRSEIVDPFWIQNKSLDAMVPMSVGSYVEGAPCPYFRKVFSIDKPIKRARLYITSLGIYKASINGKAITDNVLTPGWTEYDKILHYQTYNITDKLTNGKNAIGVIVADGWYSGCVGLFGRGYYGNTRSLYCKILIEYNDGEKIFFGSDNTWKTSRGAFEYSDIMLGEYYDATKEIIGWDTKDFDDNNWENARKMSDDYCSNFKGDFKSQVNPPMKIFEILKPISINKIAGSKLIVDFGQNMAGWIKIKIKAKVGTIVTIRHGEMLTDEGFLYTENLRNAKATDIYKCKGNNQEVFEPSFTFHGFRYAEISGLDYILDKDDIEGHVVYSSNEWIGHFECDNPMVNKLYQNILWGQRGNFLDVPTDCPQRDERLGWSGDTQVFVKSACYNSHAVNFYKKWITDLVYSQRIDGSYTDVVPYISLLTNNLLTGSSDAGSPAWGDAGVIVPYTIYLMFGDINILKDNYHSMKKFIDFYENDCDNYLRRDIGYGDWLSIDDTTPREVVSTAFVAYSASLMQTIALVLGYKEDCAYYEDLFCNVKNAFNKSFVNQKTGEIKGDTQTGYLMTLKFNLVEGELKNLVVQKLKDRIIRNGYKLSTGFIGVSYLLPMLSEYGLDDIAYTILLQEEFPSWFYSIKNGATTIWERWNSYTVENGLSVNAYGFADTAMNSFNHYSLGSVSEWFYQYMGGIMPKIECPAFKEFIIKPHLDPKNRIKKSSVEYDSMNGLIKSKWETEGNSLKMCFEIPANTTCDVYIPKIDENMEKEKLSLSDNEYLVFKENTKYYFLFSCQSGSYEVSY